MCVGGGGGGGEGERVLEGSTADTARKRPERLWTAARTMEVLRWCPLAMAQRLVHRAIDDLRKSRGLHSVNAYRHGQYMLAGVAQSRHAFVGGTMSTWGR